MTQHRVAPNMAKMAGLWRATSGNSVCVCAIQTKSFHCLYFDGSLGSVLSGMGYIISSNITAKCPQTHLLLLNTSQLNVELHYKDINLSTLGLYTDQQ